MHILVTEGLIAVVVVVDSEPTREAFPSFLPSSFLGCQQQEQNVCRIGLVKIDPNFDNRRRRKTEEDDERPPNLD